MIQINCQGLALGYHSALMRILTSLSTPETTSAFWEKTAPENPP